MPPGHTLQTVRRRVMARFGDLLTATATANGTTTTFVDEDTIVGEPGRFAGRQVMFVTGANAGEERYIEGSSRDGATLTFSRALPNATLIGDTLDITNAYGLGITFRAVRDAINYAIDISRDYALIPASFDVVDPFDADGATITIPETFVGVERVSGFDDEGVYRPISRATTFNGNGWSVDRASREVVIRGYRGRRADGRTVVLHGYTLPEPLVNDADVTTVDLEWLIETATSHLCLDSLLSRQATGDWASKGMLYQQRAERLRSRLTPVLGPSFVRVD